MGFSVAGLPAFLKICSFVLHRRGNTVFGITWVNDGRIVFGWTIPFNSDCSQFKLHTKIILIWFKSMWKETYGWCRMDRSLCQRLWTRCMSLNQDSEYLTMQSWSACGIHISDILPMSYQRQTTLACADRFLYRKEKFIQVCYLYTSFKLKIREYTLSLLFVFTSYT